MTTTEAPAAVEADATDSTQLHAVVEAYFAALNETDTARRADRLAEAFTPDGTYGDPLGEYTGYDAIGAMVAEVHVQFPGEVFRRTTGIDVHHGRARFGWELAAADGTVHVPGLDVVEQAPDGRIACVTGWFGPLPDM